MINYYIDGIKKYGDIEGRATRSEYWYFTLVSFVIAIGCAVLIALNENFKIVYALYALAMIVPTFTLTVRRLHDTNRSGWWILINFVPFFGAIIFLYFMVQDSVNAENRYTQNISSETASNNETISPPDIFK